MQLENIFHKDTHYSPVKTKVYWVELVRLSAPLDIEYLVHASLVWRSGARAFKFYTHCDQCSRLSRNSYWPDLLARILPQFSRSQLYNRSIFENSRTLCKSNSQMKWNNLNIICERRRRERNLLRITETLVLVKSMLKTSLALWACECHDIHVHV